MLWCDYMDCVQQSERNAMMGMLYTLYRSLRFVCLICVTLLAAGYFLYAAVTLIWAKPYNLNQHDAIVVLTGQSGRIESGLRLLLDNKADMLLITGVLQRLSKKELIAAHEAAFDTDEMQKLYRHCCITLDYNADTTETNAIEANKWINDKDIKSLILVTSASHMPRAYLNFSMLIDKDTNITTYPVRTQRRLSLVVSPKFWSYTAREYFKFCGSLIRLRNLK